MLALIRIALRNVVRNRRRSLITLSAVFVALTVMMMVRGALNGLQATVRENVIYGQTGAVQVHRKGWLKAMQGGLDLDLPADEEFLGKIAAVPHVTAVAPRIPFGGMVNANDRTVFAVMNGLDAAREPKVCPRRFERISVGVAIDPKQPAGANLTTPLLGRLGLKLGDSVAILTGDRDGVLNAADAKVVGAFPEMGMLAADKKFAMVPLALAQEVLRMPGRATEVAVAVDDLDDIPSVVAGIQAAVGPEYEVSRWNEIAAFVDQMIKGQDTVLTIIFWVFLIVAELGIANTMLMSVRERTREIGTMMAVGVRRRQIVLLFLLEAALIGLAGGVLGGVTGGLIVRHYHTVGIPLRLVGSTTVVNIYPFVTAPFVLLTFAAAAGGAAVAALLPAQLASKLRPVEALSGG